MQVRTLILTVFIAVALTRQSDKTDRHPFHSVFSTTIWVSRQQKAKDDGVAVASGGPYANHLHLAPDR